MLQQTITHSVNQSVNQAMRTVSARPCGAVRAHVPQFASMHFNVVLKSARSANSAHTARHWRSSANSQRGVIVSCFDATPTTAVRRPLVGLDVD